MRKKKDWKKIYQTAYLSLDSRIIGNLNFSHWCSSVIFRFPKITVYYFNNNKSVWSLKTLKGKRKTLSGLFAVESE